MTKESILDEHVKYAWECDQASPVIPYSAAEKAMDQWAGHLISNSSRVTTTLQVPKHILDEYAKQQAIAFLKRHIVFTDESMYEKSYSNFLDNRFIEQQNKDNGSTSDR